MLRPILGYDIDEMSLNSINIDLENGKTIIKQRYNIYYIIIINRINIDIE